MFIKSNIRHLLLIHGLNPNSLAVASDEAIPQPTTHRVLTIEGYTPRDPYVEKVAKYFGITPVDLKYKDLSMQSNVSALAKTDQVYDYEDTNGLHEVIVINAKLSAGKGRENPVCEEDKKSIYRESYFKKLGVKPDDIIEIKIDGRSMEPTLWDGSYAVINTVSHHIPYMGGVFAFILNGDWLVKRLHPVENGLKIMSDNEEYGSNMTLTNEQLASLSFEMIGRVVDQHGGNINF